MKTYIRVLIGATAEQEVLLDQSVITCGRHADNDLILDDNNTSRHHCRFVSTGDSKYLLEDVGSSNGTYVNGILIRSKVLNAGDQIRIGGSSLEVTLESSQSGSSASVSAISKADDFGIQFDPAANFDTTELVVESQVASYSKTNDKQNFVQAEFDLDYVYRASLISSKNLTLPNLCRNFASLVCDWASATQGLLVLLDESNSSFSQIYSSPTADDNPINSPTVESLKVRLNRELVDHVIDCRLPSRSDFEVLSETLSDTRDQASGAQQITAMCVPIDNGEKLFGVIYVDNLGMDDRRANHVFSNEGLRELAAIGKQAAAAIENNEYLRSALGIARQEAVDTLTSAVSHRINNLLHAVNGGEFLVGAGLQANDINKVAQAWHMVKGAQNRLNHLLVNLTMHCRDFSPVMRDLNLHETIQTIASELRNDFGETRLNIQHRTDTDLTLELDSIYLERVLKNVLSVGLTASSCGDDDQDVVTLDTSLSSDEVLIRVSFRHFDEHFDLAQLGETVINKVNAEHGFLEMIVCRKMVKCQGGTISFALELENLNSIEIKFPLNLT